MAENTNFEKASPLQVLQDTLEDDMNAVNSLILDRLKGDVPMIEKIAAYLIASGGKRIRPLLTLACGEICKADKTDTQKLAAAVEFIHSATLLHDDVVDGSDQRRGKDSANEVFDNKAPVLVGDFLFSRSFQLMVETDNMAALKTLADAAAIIAEGEVLQLSLINQTDMTREQYFQIIRGKTAALFAAACEVAPILAGQNDKVRAAFYEYGLNLGVAFQIADDVLDYAADAKTLGKNIGDDFVEGKITLPVLICIEEADDDEERTFWQRVMGKHDQKDGDLETALNYIEKHDAVEKGRKVAEGYRQECLDAIAQMPQSTLTNTLKDLCDFVIYRGK